MPSRDAKALQTALLATPTDLEPDAVRDVAGALNVLLADMIALYLKTKNFHWHGRAADVDRSQPTLRWIAKTGASSQPPDWTNPIRR
jgi:hypothetical protein